MTSRQIRGITNPDFLRATRIAAVNRRVRRGREKRSKRELPPFGGAVAATIHDSPETDPVRIAVLAMETLGRASMRASFTGTEVEVTAPDEAVAAIFRAALAETRQNRPTDRLIRVVVD